jgi:DNA-directed RNA polymerase subunit M/transcription elongation factor TFIIS
MDSLRIEKFKELYCANQDIVKVLVIAEAFAWSSACKKGLLYDVPVWKYSNGSILFETDKNELHKKEYMSSYLEQMYYIELLLKIPETRQQLIENPCKIEDLNSIIDPRTQSSFRSWQAKHLQGIKEAKAVLEETVDKQDAFIQCRRCKSFSVDTEQKQTRSADEPMTIFCVCRQCKNAFRKD